MVIFPDNGSIKSGLTMRARVSSSSAWMRAEDQISGFNWSRKGVWGPVRALRTKNIARPRYSVLADIGLMAGGVVATPLPGTLFTVAFCGLSGRIIVGIKLLDIPPSGTAHWGVNAKETKESSEAEARVVTDGLRHRAEGAEEALRCLRLSETNRALVLQTANQVAFDILGRRTGIEALRHIADAARMLSGARYAALGVARPDGHGLQEFITVGLTEGEESVIGARPRGVGVLGLLLGRREPLRLDSLADHPASAGFPPNHPPMKSFLGVPIRRGDTIMGSLYLTDKEGADAFTEADETAVEALGAHAAIAIHNLQMLWRQRALVSGLIAAQEEERRAVAFDLHDGLTQFVMAAHAHMESFRRAQETGRPDKAARDLDQGMRYLKEAVVESRRLVNGLRTLALDDLGLAGALEQLVREEKARAGWEEADLIHNVAGRRFDKTLETAAYRVAQEALTNARKHAETRRVRLVLLLRIDDTEKERLTLEVRDWGKGFVPEHHDGGSARVGLQSMAERVHLLEGDYELVSAPGAGTVVSAVFPVQDPSEVIP